MHSNISTRTAHITLFLRHVSAVSAAEAWIQNFMDDCQYFQAWKYSISRTPNDWHIVDKSKRPLLKDVKGLVVAIRINAPFVTDVPVDVAQIDVLCSLSSRVFSNNGMFLDLEIKSG